MPPWLLGNHNRRGHGAGNNAHRQSSRRLVWRRLQEATSIVDQIIRRRFRDAVMLDRVANTMGLDVETILVHLQEEAADLEKQTFRGTAGGRGSTECAICLEGFQDGEEVSVLPCSHGFHPHCITKWLRRSNMCPLCRHQLPLWPVK